MEKRGKTSWWFNDGYICMSMTPEFTSVSCRKFDPWQGRFAECLWGDEKKVAEVDTQGLEDPKLFVWPGKGVYAVFGRKPEALGASPYCRDPIFVQFIVQVVSEDSADDWTLHRPRELKLGRFAPAIYAEAAEDAAARGEHVKEKNWMPFVHEGELYMAHTVMPHRVLRMTHSGVAVQQWLSTNDALMAQFAGQDVHGGPPVVRIEGSGGAAPYYLGVLHFFMTFGEGKDRVKHYHHYAYKMEAGPPFRVCAVSDEIPLVTRKKESNPSQPQLGDWTHQRIWKDTSQTAYVSGLFVDAGRVLLSYGSSDIDARLLALGLGDLEALFKAPFDCSGAVVLEDGAGEPLPPRPAAAGGNASALEEYRRRKTHRRMHRRERSLIAV
ncbi:MAG: hypothetical protein J3K34DRAFT_424307 [Monoraphidium minutum]|nr:MAG: hypothetical protein J3K34DRAFT_424307 [Monoraphidium minutum]